MERERPRGKPGDESGEPLDGERRPRAQGSVGAQLSADETQRLLRRAAELERARGERAPEVSLDWQEVERIGIEAGLSREAIQRAFAELRTGALEPAVKPTLAERWIGPASLAVHTLLPLAPDEARRKLHAIFKDELLHPEERKGARTTWTPAPGLWASIQRGINWQGQAAWHRGTVVSEISQAPEGMAAGSIVRLEASPGGRKGPFLASLLPALTLLPIAVISCFAPHAVEQGVPVIIVGMGAVTSGGLFALLRLQYQKRLRAVRVALERVLGKLTGEPGDL